MSDLEIARPALSIKLFGPVQVVVEGHPLSSLRSRKALSLLALLALRQGQPVEREWIAGTLWPDAEQSQAFASLRPVLSELRRALGRQAHCLQSPNRHTLSLNRTGVEVDVTLFDAGIASGNTSEVERAVALYRGPLMEGSFEEWVAQERVMRAEHCLQALRGLADTAIAEGDYGTATEHARRAVALDPWREVARRQLMVALSQGGNLNAALQVYREFIRFIGSDPKAVPDAETQALYARLRTEARSRAKTPAAADLPAPVQSPPRVTGFLPHPLTELVGREEERFEVTTRLQRSRLVTLTGPGGVGKTRLALTVAADIAREFPDGVWMVALESLREGNQVIGQIAMALNLKETPGRSPVDNLTGDLRAKRLLLILDNCEHLLEACVKVVAHLLRECAGLSVLATSREALGITGESAWAVPPLSVPEPAYLPVNSPTLLRVMMAYEGIQLFVQRAQAVQRGFTLGSGNALAVAQVCAQLEGLPLALELAAARIRAMTVAQIAARLDNRLGLLTGGNRATISRQQTLRATLDWSYELLNASEQRMLRCLSVFSGGWDLEAAERICGSDILGETEGGTIPDLLTGLVDKSLVVFEPRDEDIGGRYRLLETVRQYATEWLRASGEAAQVRNAHARYFLALAEDAEPYLGGVEQAKWLRRLETEQENFLAALRWVEENDQDGESELRLVGALSRFWVVRGYYRTGRQFLERSLGRKIAPERNSARARALFGAGALAAAENDYTSAQQYYEDSLEIFREVNNRLEVARTLVAISHIALVRGDHQHAQGLLEECLAIFREQKDKRGIAQTLSSLGNILNEQNDYSAAQTLFQESLQLYEEIGDRRSTGFLLGHLGSLASARRDYLAARSLYERGLQLFEEIGDRKSMAMVINYLGNLAGREGNYPLSQKWLEESVGIHRELGDRRALAWALASLGNVYKAQDQFGASQVTTEESLFLFEEIGDRRGAAVAQLYLGEVALHAGDTVLSRTLYRESLSLSRELQDKMIIALDLIGLGMVDMAEQRASVAVRLWGAATALRVAIGMPSPLQESEEFKTRVEEARLTLGDTGFTTAWDTGHDQPWDQTVAFVLEESETKRGSDPGNDAQKVASD